MAHPGRGRDTAVEGPRQDEKLVQKLLPRQRAASAFAHATTRDVSASEAPSAACIARGPFKLAQSKRRVWEVAPKPTDAEFAAGLHVPQFKAGRDWRVAQRFEDKWHEGVLNPMRYGTLRVWWSLHYELNLNTKCTTRMVTLVSTQWLLQTMGRGWRITG
jgi:hypothetical protein